jgi:hypothetical protein
MVAGRTDKFSYRHPDELGRQPSLEAQLPVVEG